MNPDDEARTMRADDQIAALLERVRTVLGMDVCFVGEHGGGKRTIRFIEGPSESFGFAPGSVEPADATYCQRMIDGLLPPLVPDARADARTASLPITAQRRIGSYAGFPIVLPSGRVYGTLCALGHEARLDLDDRDLDVLRFVAADIAERLAASAMEDEAADEARDRVRSVLAGATRMAVHYQPIVDLRSGEPVGYEALARFGDGRSPALWFDDAWRAGLGTDLEIRAAELAVAGLEQLPEGTYLSVNASPKTILSRPFDERAATRVDGRFVVEITEHASVTNYPEMLEALRGILARGVRLAIDDAGAGHASMSHIVHLEPDIIKLDRVFTKDIGSEPARRALAAAMVSFSREIGATLVAEGIETDDELQTLRRLGVRYGQGYLLGKPEPLTPGARARAS